MSEHHFPTVGAWISGPRAPAFHGREMLECVQRVREPAFVVRDAANGRLGVGLAGEVLSADRANGRPTWPLLASLPALYPEWLGDRSFCEAHRVRFPYVAGAMANGIATTELVIAMAHGEMLAFFGAAGLPLPRVEQALDELENALGIDGQSWGSNLIHSPNEPDLEAAVVDLYLRRGVRRVSASAYMALTPHVVRYAVSGLRRDPRGQIQRRNHLFAKISRPEVARHFMSPAPAEILDGLVAAGKLTAEEAVLAREVPVAEDYTVEADSGGHTDNQTLTALFPTIMSLRDEISRTRGYHRPIRVGAAGGLGTPSSIAAAFSLGAAFVVTGSVNQCSVESGLSDDGRALLVNAGLADVVMAAAADMFELGVKVQVLKRGTMFAVRANRLYDIYGAYDSLDSIPAAERSRLESEIFKKPLETVWSETETFFAQRDPSQNERAARDPKHRMALVFRWYLGQSSRWAIAGDPDRRMDYQIWCGPAMGAFNDWVKGSFLEKKDNRTVVQIARNMMEGATVVSRAQQLRSYGLPVPPAAFAFRPRLLS